jgi:hypothetical protein
LLRRRFFTGDVLLRRRCVYRRFVWRRFVEETFCRGDVLYVRRNLYLYTSHLSASPLSTNRQVVSIRATFRLQA